MSVDSRWNLSSEQKSEIVERLMAIVTNQASKPRDINAAVRNLISLELQNQKDEHEHAADVVRRLIEIANDRGSGGGGEIVDAARIVGTGGVSDEE